MDITAFVRAIEKQNLHCEGVMVSRHGETVADYRWIPDTLRNCHSVSKSFTSIAIGMAVERGKLSLTDRVLDAFPGAADKPSPRLASLTLEHLLTMTRGHAEFSRPATVVEALAQDLTFEPGERFVYDNGSTFLASAMFTHAMGMTVRDFLLGALFRPLGIPDPEWAESADGHTIGATGLSLTTASLALFGRLLLQRGYWRDKQLVSPRWIDSASRPQVSSASNRPDYNLGYGYGFWPCRHGAFRADGKDGQFVITLPRQDAVVAINSNEPRHYPILYAVWDEILPLL
ncbi:MAG: beta-lactamase family protein [Treponema sp.]|jgi:CubicO group peptidase (beta-lactamase class C family)|nr:beta-lactamase family protein [Treponema sp.]